MAELLAELVAKITADATELKKALSESEKDIQGTGQKLEKETKSWQEQFKAVGKLAIGMGASITAAMTMAIMSFTKSGSELHDLSLKTGVSAKALAGLQYAAEQNGASLGTVEMAIRRTASAMQDAKDGLAETKRGFDRMGLSLTELEGLNPEEQFMKIAGAIAEIPDPMTRAATAQDLFGRSGMDMLPMLSEGAAGLQKMMEEGQKLTGWTDEGANSADALGDAFGTLKTSTMGIFNAIGSSLAPTLQVLIDTVTRVVKSFTAWAKEHPALIKNLGLITLAVGAFLTIAGALVLLAPTIAAAWATAMGPVGITIIAITGAIVGLIAVGMLLWQNWDKVSHFFSDTWSNMQNAALHAIDAILGGLQNFIGWIPGLGSKIAEARNAIANMIDANKVARDAKDVERSAQAMTGTIKAELEKQKADALANYAAQKVAAQSLYDSNIAAIKKEYGVYESTSTDKQSVAKALSAATKKALDDELKQAQRVHDDKMDLLQREYDQKIKTLNAEADYQIASIQSQIDAIDRQTEKEDLIITRANEQKRLAELQAAVDSAATDEDRVAAQKALEEYTTEVVRNELLRKRDAEKDALRAEIDDIRTRTQAETDRLATELEANTTQENSLWEILQARLNTEKDALDTALLVELKRLDDERIAKELLEKQKLTATLTTLTNEETAIKTSFDARLTEAAIYQAALEAVLKDINQTVTTTYVSNYTSSGNEGPYIGGIPTSSSTPNTEMPGYEPTPPGYQHGGIVTQPTMAMVGEAGPEAIIPLNETGVMGNIIINFTQPVFFDREDSMNKLVEKIRKGIQRQDRLRFGGAYSGG